MGIPGLTKFMNARFSKWKPADLKTCDKVIIDGNNICHTLYGENHTWCYGGEYKQFSKTVERFFTEAGIKHPIVIFDGANDPKKMGTQRERRKDSIKAMYKLQSQMEWDPSDPHSRQVSPLFIVVVFMDVLRKLKIEFHVANDDADGEIAALANHYECPVLASDSDFFIYELKCGFIHFDRYRNKKEESFYHICDFQEQFSLKQHELCLLIPSLFGNDYIKSENKMYDCAFHLMKIAKYKTSDEYLASNDVLFRVTTVEKFKDAKRQYFDLKLPTYYTTNVAVVNPAFPNLPQWVMDSLKRGNFPTHLLGIYYNYSRTYLLPRAVECITENDAWEISRPIRQFQYGIMGISVNGEVREVVRKNVLELSDKVVSPKNFKGSTVTIQDQFFIHKDEESLRLSDLVLAVLKCHKISEDDIQQEFNTLNDKWKLPIAATFYWYQNLKNPPTQRYLVKSLLLSFLTCSEVIDNQHRSLEPINPGTKRNHLLALHAFAKWQCVYYDARALNCLAREPFPTTSPACLYSGEVAMYYASISDRKIDGFITKRSEEWKWNLFNKFLYLVTGSDEEGRRGKHRL